jgi:hypothetical protein
MALTEIQKAFNRLVTYTIRLGQIVAHGDLALLILPDDVAEGDCPVCRELMSESGCHYLPCPDADPGEINVICKNVARVPNVIDLNVQPEAAFYRDGK